MDARRSARNAPCAHKAQEGVKGGTLAGGSPFAGGPAARSPCAAVGLAVNEGKGRRGRRPLQGWCGDTGSAVIPASGRGWNPAPTRGRRNVARWAADERSGRRGRRPLRVAARPGRVPRDLPGAGRGGGNGENAATGGVLVSFAGRRTLRGRRVALAGSVHQT